MGEWITIRDGNGVIIKTFKARGRNRGEKQITATKGEQMKRKFGRSPLKKWGLMLKTEFGKVR